MTHQERPDDVPATSYGSVLRDLRTERAWSLREIERRTNGALKSSHLSQIETGKVAQPSLSVLRELARVFGLNFSEFVRYLNMNDDGGQPSVTEKDRMAMAFFSELDPSDKENVLSYMRYLDQQHKTRPAVVSIEDATKPPD